MGKNCKLMKYLTVNYFSLILIFISASLLYSCSSMQHLHKNKTNNVLTQKQKYKEADLFARAITLKETGHLKMADSLLQKALTINPNDPAANYELAAMTISTGNVKKAMQYAAKAIKLDSTNKWYRVLYGNIAKMDGNYKAYVNSFKKLVEKYPENEQFVQELANAYNFTGDYKDAVKMYIKLQGLIGRQERLSQKIANLYVRLGEKSKALNEYEKLIQYNPDNPRSYALLAEFATKNNFPEKAELAYKKIIALNPKDPYVHISMADFYRKQKEKKKAFEELVKGFSNPLLDVKTEINLLAAYYSGNLNDEQTKQALELATVMKKVHPNNKLAEAFYASMLYQNKKYEQARPLLQKAISNNPDNYALWEQLLFTDLGLQKYSILLSDADSVIKKFSYKPIPYMMAGIATFQNKKYKESVKYLLKGKNLVAGNNSLLEQFYSSLGDAYHELKMKNKAYNAYDYALKLNPDNAIVLNNYAYYLAEDGTNLNKAEKMAAKAVKIDPYNQNNLDTYAWVLFKLKKYQQALNWEEKALNNGGKDSGVVVEHYGDILFKLGEKKKAFTEWKKALKLKDHSKNLLKKIKTGKLIE